MKRLFTLWLVVCAFCVGLVPALGWDLQHVNHPTTGLSGALKMSSGSIASLSMARGSYYVDIDLEFFYELVDVGPRKRTSLTMHSLFGQLSSFVGLMRSSYNTTMIVADFDGIGSMFDAMIRAGHIEREDVRFSHKRSAIYQRLKQAQFGTSHCSSFRVAADIYFTANHCMRDQWECEKTRIRHDEEFHFYTATKVAYKKIK